MPNYHDKTGLRFGRLTALEPQGRAPSGNVCWLCQCDCGKTTIVASCFLATGHTKSCGCFRRDSHVTHGQWKTPTYRSWQEMHERCRDPKHKYYKNYGGRGVGIDDPRWNEYPPFLVDMGERPPGGELHRKNNDKGYSKENCMWLPRAAHRRLHASIKRQIKHAPRLINECAPK